MICGWRSWLGLLAVLSHTPPLPAQHASELGAHVMIALADRDYFGAGAYGGRRVSERTRLAVTLAAGAVGNSFAPRAELLAHFMLNPGSRSQPGVYVGGGVAYRGGPADQGLLVFTLGLEAHPGAPAGWAIEAGVGGGARIVAGYRWRFFPSRLGRRN